MVVTTRSASLIAALAMLQVPSAANSTNSTEYDSCANFHVWDNGFNATGSVSVPGPKPNDSYPDTTWTWSRYVHDVYDQGLNTSDIWQSLGLKTSPVQNLSDPSTPYTGCVIAIAQLNSATAKDTSKDNGNCSAVFGDDCLAEIRNSIQDAASSYSGTPAGSANSFECSNIFDGITFAQNSSSKCSANLFAEVISSQFLPNNFTGYSNPVCPITNPGDSNVTDGHRSFFSWGSPETQPDNHTIYDMAVTSHVPVFVATWLKNASNATGLQELTPGSGWADTQIMCIPANETQPGSRNFTEAESTQTGAAIKVNGLGMGVLGVFGLTVLFGLLL